MTLLVSQGILIVQVRALLELRNIPGEGGAQTNYQAMEPISNNSKDYRQNLTFDTKNWVYSTHH